MQQSKKICVIGLGYIGLPTAALLANRGYDVHGVECRIVIVITWPSSSYGTGDACEKVVNFLRKTI